MTCGYHTIIWPKRSSFVWLLYVLTYGHYVFIVSHKGVSLEARGRDMNTTEIYREEMFIKIDDPILL